MAAILLEDPIRINYTIIGRREWLREVIPVENRQNYQYIVVDKHDDLNPVYWFLNSQPKLGWDCETSGSKDRPKDGLHAHSSTNRIILFQIGTPQFVYLVDPGLLVLYPHFKALMENEDIQHIGQNSVFDFKEVLAKAAIHPLNMWCTMLAEQVRTAGIKGLRADLKSLVRRFRPYLTISKGVRDEFEQWPGYFSESQLYYSARDVVLLFPVQEQQEESLTKLELMPTAQVEFDCIPVTAEMELGGLDISLVILEQIREYSRRKAQALEHEIHRIYNESVRNRIANKSGLFEDTQGWATINLASPQDKIRMFHSIGIMVKSTDSEELEALDHPLGPMTAKWMNYNKILTTYCERTANNIHPDTNRYHPRFLQMGEGDTSEVDKADSSSSEKGTIATGRYSSNAQQWPKEKQLFEKITDPQLLAVVHEFFAARLSELAQKQAA